MNIKKLFVVFIALWSISNLWADEDEVPGLDVPGQEQKLNAQLWQFAKNTSYAQVEKDPCGYPSQF